VRVAAFRRAVIATDTLHRVESQIAFEDGAAGMLEIKKLEIASPAGATMIKEAHVEIKRGERVLIVGEPGTGKTLLFRALAGLWPWGSGTVIRPKGEEILYMPHAPYWSPATLREALSYPLKVENFNEKAFGEALRRLDLEQLVPILERGRNWEQNLSEDQLTRLAFARVVLHAPPWILIDEVLDSLDADTRALINDVFAKDLKDSTVIHIGREIANDTTFKRILHLIRDPAVRRLSGKKGKRRKKPPSERSSKRA
jgi:putative ATP-binding cassette transporter